MARFRAPPSSETAKRKPFLLDLYGTAVGKKYVMAITGLIGIGFVLTHMIGNLKMYLGVITEGDERVYDIDIYGEFSAGAARADPASHILAVGLCALF